MPNLRERANVTGQAINAVYSYLRQFSIDDLKEAKAEALKKPDLSDAQRELLLHQINVTMSRKLEGTW